MVIRGNSFRLRFIVLVAETESQLALQSVDEVPFPGFGGSGPAIPHLVGNPEGLARMSGREFFGFVGTLYGMTRSDIAVQTEKYLRRFPGLQEVIDGFVESYSRGNKQKLAIVAAFMHRPKLLLIDEPMVGLDPQSALATKQLLREFSQHGNAVFLCTHTLPVAQELAHRIGVLEKGKLVAVGTLQELRDHVKKPPASLEEVYLAITEKEYRIPPQPTAIATRLR